MKLGKELRNQLVAEIEKHLKYPEDVDVSETKAKISAICIEVDDVLVIDVEDEG